MIVHPPPPRPPSPRPPPPQPGARPVVAPHPPPALASIDGLELRETHVSWVFLGRREVLKVKKPVSFGFLDFRTLEQRRVACLEEVRLNARLAPDVYLGVVPLLMDDEGHVRVGTADESGRVAEWAVRMRRLDDARRVDVRLERGTLLRSDVDLVADRIAEFHASARVDARTARYGSAAAITQAVRENFDATREAIARHLTPDEAEELERWQTAFLCDNAELLAKRAIQGRVREGHGDLRLEHVYLPEGDRDLEILDGIEFAERYRCVDVAADIAFFAMDLAAHGRVDLAERFIARYASASQDFDIYGVIDFYESYRAHVRAKVATLLAADPGAPPSLVEAAEADARRHLLLALASERRSILAPAVVAVGGIIASGKSTTAERLGEALSAPVIDADRTRKEILGVRPTEPVHERAWVGAYDPGFSEHVYDEVFRRAAVVLASGRPVVLDASFRSRAHRARVEALARRFGARFVLVECSASPAVCRARLEERARTASVSDGRLAVFDEFCRRFEPMTELGPSDRVVLDTTRGTDPVEAIRHVVATWPIGLNA